MTDSQEILVRKLSAEDFAEATEVLACAFMDDPLLNLLAPVDAERMETLRVMHGGELTLAASCKHSYGAFDEAGLNVGAIVASSPGTYPPPYWQDLKLALKVLCFPRPWVPSLRHFLKIRPYMKAMDKLHVEGPHWFVRELGVRRGFHGRGIGGKLLGIIIEQSQQDGHPIYLDTQTETNVYFYQRNGFEVTGVLHPRPDGPPSWGLLRQVR